MAANTILRDSMKTPKRLFKYLMRECNKLPTGAQEFYKHSIRQSFKQHIIEPDSERVQQIIEKALFDAEWVKKKYKIKDSSEKQKE